MAQARYIIRMANQELFGWNPDWLKIPGMVEYDPAIHGFRSEVAAQMGIVEPVPMPVTYVAVQEAPVVAEAPKQVAGNKAKKATAAVELAPTQTTPAEPDLSDVFNAK